MHRTNDPSLRSWLSIPEDTDFPIQNLPFGVFRYKGKKPRVGVAIGDEVLDLHRLQKMGILTGIDTLSEGIFKQSSLNAFFALGRSFRP